MPDDERIEELRPGAPVFAVAPVRQRRAVPRAIVLLVLVSALAFVGGIAVASRGEPAPLARSIAPPAGSPATAEMAPSARPTAAPVVSAPPAAPAPAPGSSGFATGFQPATLIATLAGGAKCVTGEARDKEVPRTRRDGPRLTFQRSWLVYCPIAEDQRQPFMLELFDGLVREVPADTFGYNAGGSGPGDALFPYAEFPLAGTVAVTADAAGDGFAVAIVLEEWRTE